MKKNQTPKPDGMLCGPACLHYIANIIYSFDKPIDDKLFWIADIAMYAKQKLGFDVELSCHESTLYNAFIMYGKTTDYPGFKSLHSYTDVGSREIYDISLNEKSIQGRLDKGCFLILNVSSRVFNHDHSAQNGHFVLVNGYNKRNFFVVNPRSKNYLSMKVSKDDLIEACRAFGNWMLVVKVP